MEKIGLLEDIIIGNSNPDVRQRRWGQTLHVRSHGGGGKERERGIPPGKVIKMINTYLSV